MGVDSVDGIGVSQDREMTREERLVRTLVEMADTLVDDFDVVDLMSLLVVRSVELLDAAAAGLVLADSHGSLRLMASTSEAMELVELFQVQHDQGPCFDCFRSGEPVIAEDLTDATGRWPRFAPFAIYSGFYAAHALPMRHRRQVIGALNLFRAEPGTLDAADSYAGQALADLATIAILQAQGAHNTHAVVDQLQHALQNRIIIEQAKGVLAERAGIGTDAAFTRLRAYARARQLKLALVAEDVIAGTLGIDDLALVDPTRASAVQVIGPDDPLS